MPPPRPIGTPAWFDLTTPEVDAAASFYEQVLGWSLESEDTPMGRYVIGETDAGPAAGLMAPPPGAPPFAGWTIYLCVGDIDAIYARAVDLGATSLQEPMEVPGGDRIAAVQDPAGAAIGFMQPTSEGSMVYGSRGAGCWIETATRDLAASRAFYTELVGWTAREGQGGYWLFDNEGEETAGMMDMPAEVPAEVPSYWTVYFSVPDVDETVAAAGELGGSTAVPAMSVDGMRFAVLEDPTGAVFGVLTLD